MAANARVPSPRPSPPSVSVSVAHPRARAASRSGPSSGVVSVTCQSRRSSRRTRPTSAPPGCATGQTASSRIGMRAYGRMTHAELLDAVWAAVPEGAEPERFAVRRDWLLARVAPGEVVRARGGGEAAFAGALAGHGARPIGVDAAPRVLRRARERHPDLDWRARELDSPLPLDDGSVDVAWLGETLEHLVDPVGELIEVRRVLRAEGRL